MTLTPGSADQFRMELDAALPGRYQVERELGRGGMAVVYLAHDVKHDRMVAIKVLDTEHSIALGAERFEREIRMLARLRHPFILPLYDSGQVADALYFVMPYIEGESLAQRLAASGPLPLEDALGIARQIADALDFAHGEGVVHRDVKPENILLSRHGHALLADFGIARATAPTTTSLTQVGLGIGTAAYMSPEQAFGESGVDGRSDVYSLGCVVHEMLSGAPPFSGPTPLAVVAQHISAPAPSLASLQPGLPAEAVAAVARALEKEPQARFASASAFLEALASRPDRTSVDEPQKLTGRLSIAVLPVSHSGSDPETEYFSDGMMEEIINALSRIEGLRVVSRTSSFAFKGGTLSLREISDKLGVGFVLEANVRRAGTRIRATARLIDVSDDSTLWSETYQRGTEDVFAVQDEITACIVETITRSLQLGHLRGAAPAQQPRNLEAYDLYLLGRHHWYLRSEPEMRRALELFEAAAEADPSYAPAFSGIADATALLASWQFAAPADMYPRAVTAAKRAIELDPQSADAHASLGFVKLNWEWDWETAERELKLATQLNPSHETAHRWLSAFYAAVGRDDEAIPIARRAIELNPVSVLPIMNLGIVHYLAGRNAEALIEFQRVLDTDPAFIRAYMFKACALSFLGQVDEAVAVATTGCERSGDHAMAVMVRVCCVALAGHTDEARAALSPSRLSELPPLYRAFVHSTLGDRESTLTELERGLEQRSDWMHSIVTQPFFNDYHADRRFVQLVRTMRLDSPADSE